MPLVLGGELSLRPRFRGRRRRHCFRRRSCWLSLWCTTFAVAVAVALVVAATGTAAEAAVGAVVVVVVAVGVGVGVGEE